MICTQIGELHEYACMHVRALVGAGASVGWHNWVDWQASGFLKHLSHFVVIGALYRCDLKQILVEAIKFSRQASRKVLKDFCQIRKECFKYVLMLELVCHHNLNRTDKLINTF